MDTGHETGRSIGSRKGSAPGAPLIAFAPQAEDATAPDNNWERSTPESRPPSVLCVTPEEAGRRLSISRSMIYRLIAVGELRSVLIGRSRRIPTKALEDFIDRRSNA